MAERLCQEHSGMLARMNTLEGDVKLLFSKWDSMQKLLVGTLVSTVISLIGIVFLLVR